MDASDKNPRIEDPAILHFNPPTESARRGWDAYASKKYPEAEEFFRSAIQEQPDDLDSMYALGMTLRYAGKSRQAVDVFQEVLGLCDELKDRGRARMVRRLASGHINQIEMGDWNLEKEVWSKKR